MDYTILAVLMVFMALFLGGGVMLLMGLMKKNRRQWILGAIILALCLAFTYAMKFVPGLY